MIDVEVKEYINERMRAVELQYEHLKDLLQAYQLSINGQFQGLRDQFQAQRDQYKALEHRITGVEHCIGGVEHRIAAVETKVDVAIGALNQLAAQQGEILAAVETLQCAKFHQSATGGIR